MEVIRNRTWAHLKYPVWAAAVLLVACASNAAKPRGTPTRSRAETTAVQRRPSEERGGEITKDDCKTVLDCMRLRGSPPDGLRWECDLGLCAAVFASHPAATK